MLADAPDTSAQAGALSKDVHLQGTFLYELLDFIADELPRWRDDPERPYNAAETVLTEHLCDHLTSASRHAQGWDNLQFRSEAVDERRKERKIDIAPKPCGAIIYINGRRHTQYDCLLPIECKRLPTPKDKDRDEREYVITRNGSTGGIQRFKAGYHGSTYNLGAMIAYVQEETTAVWCNRISGWISELVKSAQPGWTAKDLLNLEHDDKTRHLAVFRSFHTREKGLQEIELRHLWVEMN